MAFFDDEECNLVMRENSYLLLSNEKNPFDLLKNPSINDTEIKYADYLIEGQSIEIETQSNSNSDKKSSPNSTQRELNYRFLDIEESVKSKRKKEKKIFKIFSKKEEKTANKVEIEKEIEKIKDSNINPNEKEDNSIMTKSELMKIKRMRQKKVLESTRGQRNKTILENDTNTSIIEKKKSENISKKKKALQNRISAQKSIEKKKNLINQIKSEKENLSYENFLLKQELERKNLEIELLKSKLNSISQQEITKTYNFNLVKSHSKLNIISISIFVICLIICLFENSDGDALLHNHHPSMMLPVQTPLSRISRRNVFHSFQKNNTKVYRVTNDIRLYNNIKQHLHVGRDKQIQKNPGNSDFGFCLRRISFLEMCESS